MNGQTLREYLVDLAKSLPRDMFHDTPKEGAKSRYFTTKTVTINAGTIPVPGEEGLVGDAQITFCVNINRFATPEQKQAKSVERTEALKSELAALPEDVRAALFEEYAVKA